MGADRPQAIGQPLALSLIVGLERIVVPVLPGPERDQAAVHRRGQVDHRANVADGALPDGRIGGGKASSAPLRRGKQVRRDGDELQARMAFPFISIGFLPNLVDPVLQEAEPEAVSIVPELREQEALCSAAQYPPAAPAAKYPADALGQTDRRVASPLDGGHVRLNHAIRVRNGCHQVRQSPG